MMKKIETDSIEFQLLTQIAFHELKIKCLIVRLKNWRTVAFQSWVTQYVHARTQVIEIRFQTSWPEVIQFVDNFIHEKEHIEFRLYRTLENHFSFVNRCPFSDEFVNKSIIERFIFVRSINQLLIFIYNFMMKKI